MIKYKQINRARWTDLLEGRSIYKVWDKYFYRKLTFLHAISEII